MRRLLTLADTVLILFLLAAVVGSFVYQESLMAKGSVVTIDVDGTTRFRLGLAEDRMVRFRGAFGTMTVQIRSGKVAVTESDCPNRICVRTGWRYRSGEMIVCVPNNVVVRIAGEEKSIKAITG